MFYNAQPHEAAAPQSTYELSDAIVPKSSRNRDVISSHATNTVLPLPFRPEAVSSADDAVILFQPTPPKTNSQQ